MRIITQSKKSVKHIVVTALLCIPFLSYSQSNSLESKIYDIYNQDARLTSAFVGMQVVDLQSDSVLVSLNAHKSMLPASIIKMYTTATALHYLGPDFQYKTYISYTGSVNAKGELNGNIVVHGAGDPTLGSKSFPERKHFLDTIVQKVLDYGIKTVKGQIVIDCSLFDSQAIPTSWVWEDLGRSYAAGVYPIAINDNVFSITFSSPQLDTAQRKGLTKVENRTPPAIAVSPYEIESKDTVKFDEKRGSFVVRGSIPAPQEIVGVELVQRFIEKGLFNYRQDYMPVVIPVRGVVDTIGVLCSPKLQEIITIVNEQSNNNYAEHLAKYLGYTVYKDGSFSAGTKAIVDFTDTIGVENKSLVMYDGSGLSRFNVTTAAHMTEFLKQMKQQKSYDVFFKTLPIANQTGTLKAYGFPKEMTGKVIAKTGSMTKVRNLAGYMTTKSGKEVAFTLMINGQDCSAREARAAIVSMLQTIYNSY